MFSNYCLHISYFNISIILITVSISEDVSESIVPWWAHTYSAERVPMETIAAIEDAIPARFNHDFCLIVLHCPKTISL